MASLLAALCENLSSTFALHACAEAVLFVTAAHMWLIRPFRQGYFSSISLGFRCAHFTQAAACHSRQGTTSVVPLTAQRKRGFSR